MSTEMDSKAERSEAAKRGDLRIEIHPATERSGLLIDRPLTADDASKELTRKCFEYSAACREHYGQFANGDVSRLFGEVVDAAKVLGYWAAREEKQ